MLVLVSSLRAQTHKVPSATFLLSRRRNAAIKVRVTVKVKVRVKVKVKAKKPVFH